MNNISDVWKIRAMKMYKILLFFLLISISNKSFCDEDANINLGDKKNKLMKEVKKKDNVEKKDLSFITRIKNFFAQSDSNSGKTNSFSKEEIKKILLLGSRSNKMIDFQKLIGDKMQNMDLSNLTLKNINFENIDLAGSDFTKSILINISFKKKKKIMF